MRNGNFAYAEVMGEIIQVKGDMKLLDTVTLTEKETDGLLEDNTTIVLKK